jgi:aminoglycoside phosphotransferase (APT) family kinase protein
MPAAVVETVRGPLGAAVSRRSPLVAAALEEEQAWTTAQVWAARAVPDAAVEAVRVGSVLYRPDGGCTLRYRVRLAPGGRAPAGPEQLLLVAVPPARTGVVVRSFPDDPELPTLRSALDPVLMTEVLGRVLDRTGRRATGRWAVDVVRYPRQGRCVLRYRLPPGPGELRCPEVFGKVHTDATASAAASALGLRRAGARRLPDHLCLTVPRPLAVVPSLRLGLVEAVAGRPVLPDLLKRACGSGGELPAADPRALPDAVRAAARMAAAVHAVHPAAAALPARTPPAERSAAERALAQLEPVWPQIAQRLQAGTVGALAGALAGPPPAGWALSPVLAHGDFTPGQVLLDGSGTACLVDVDTTCVAERALDLGRFLAYLHVAGVRRSPAAWPLLAELSALFLEDYLASCAPAGGPRGAAADTRRLLLERTAAYRALSLARLGASACWQLKDDRLRAVLDVLDAGDEWRRDVRG